MPDNKPLLRILFDGPPSPESGRFVEVENADGASFNCGEWTQENDLWVLSVTNIAEADILAQPCVVEALKKAYLQDPHKVLQPWADNVEEAGDCGPGWVWARTRQDIFGNQVGVTGTNDGDPLFSIEGVLQDTPGGEVEADAWLLANGYVLL